jgi:hypothetical protein
LGLKWFGLGQVRLASKRSKFDFNPNQTDFSVRLGPKGPKSGSTGLIILNQLMPIWYILERQRRRSLNVQCNGGVLLIDHEELKVRRLGRKMSGFLTVHILKICQTPGLDMMFGRALQNPVHLA